MTYDKGAYMSSASNNSYFENIEKFDGAFQVLARLLSISKSTRALLYLKLAEIDFCNGQDELILLFDDDEIVGMSTVAYRLNVRPSTVSKMIDRLLLKGLLERIGDESDARRTIVRLTPAGVEAREKIRMLRARLETELFGKISHERMHGVASSLDLLEDTLKSRLAKLR
jgi:DNA-binding MarR family transcriptional regulator